MENLSKNPILRRFPGQMKSRLMLSYMPAPSLNLQGFSHSECFGPTLHLYELSLRSASRSWQYKVSSGLQKTPLLLLPSHTRKTKDNRI